MPALPQALFDVLSGGLLAPAWLGLVEHRARRAAVLEARLHDAADRLRRLQAWCHEAAACGIHALQQHASRLKGYALAAH